MGTGIVAVIFRVPGNGNDPLPAIAATNQMLKLAAMIWQSVAGNAGY
jgi:hypothetical protein